MKFLKTLERVLFVGGIALLGFFTVAYISGKVYSHMSLKRFHAEVAKTSIAAQVSPELSPVNFSLWSEKRIRAYQASLEEHFGEAQAVLRIERIRLEVPVFDGTDDLTLNRGVGRIIGTARLGDPGNIGIAGHRDGFFRGLKDVSVGDTVQLATRSGVWKYTIDKVRIVAPGDVSVLRSESTPALTLVTCYPFYFIGNAPQRYIVHATLQGKSETANPSVKASLKATDSHTKENAK